MIPLLSKEGFGVVAEVDAERLTLACSMSSELNHPQPCPAKPIGFGASQALSTLVLSFILLRP